MDLIEKRGIYEEFAELNEDPSFFLDLRLIKNEPRRDATIAFFCYSFKDYFALKDIVRAFPQAEFVLAPAIYDIKNFETRFYYNTLIRALNKEGLPWRIFIPSYTLDDFFARKYTTLVTRRPSPFFRDAELVTLRKIFIVDSDLPIALTGAYATKGAETFLIPGPDEEYPFRHYAATRSVGISRFDAIKRETNAENRGTNLLYVAEDIFGAKKFAAVWQQITRAQQARSYSASIIIPTLPHGNDLPKHLMRQCQILIYSLDKSGVQFFYENDNPYHHIAQADVIMLEKGHFLFDAVWHELPVIFHEYAFDKGVSKYNSSFSLFNFRNFMRVDPQYLDIGVTLQQMQNLPAALEAIEQNREICLKNLRRLKEKFLLDQNGNAAKQTKEAILEESTGERRPENVVTRILSADMLIRNPLASEYPWK